MELAEDLVSTFVSLYREVHEAFRAVVREVDEPALRWSPGPDTNSISTLIVHTLGSEEEVLRIVAGLPSDRDRPAEFTGAIADRTALLARIGAVDGLLVDVGARITGEELAAERVRPSAVRNRAARPGLFWLLNSYGHAREHLAHLELTRQLYAQTVHPPVIPAKATGGAT